MEPLKPNLMIGVMGPGTWASPEEMDMAHQLGGLLARQGWTVLSGGRNQGIMDAVSRGAVEAGGLTFGILPGADRHGMSPWVRIPIVTEMGNARNNINILSSDFLVICGLGAGTASEIALALKTGKQVIFLNPQANILSFFKKLHHKTPSQTKQPAAVIKWIKKQLKQQ